MLKLVLGQLSLVSKVEVVICLVIKEPIPITVPPRMCDNEIELKDVRVGWHGKGPTFE